jgi:hypothetical protein
MARSSMTLHGDVSQTTGVKRQLQRWIMASSPSGRRTDQFNFAAEMKMP